MLTYVTDPLDAPAHVYGRPEADIFFATTGTDADVVVKLIDVYPDEMADLDLAGYEAPVAMEIFRDRYVQALNHAAPLTPGRGHAVPLRAAPGGHVFAKGHRIMVQAQSSWFPVFDRNPQTFVPNIFNAKLDDYRKVTMSLMHTPIQASAIRLPIAGR